MEKIGQDILQNISFLCRTDEINVYMSEMTWVGKWWYNYHFWLWKKPKRYIQHESDEKLTRKVAMATPMIKPAMTSDQWLRYSATLLIPVRKARHIRLKDITGLARRLPLAFTVNVMYIWNHRERNKIYPNNDFDLQSFVVLYSYRSICQFLQYTWSLYVFLLVG